MDSKSAVFGNPVAQQQVKTEVGVKEALVRLESGVSLLAELSRQTRTSWVSAAAFEQEHFGRTDFLYLMHTDVFSRIDL